MRLLALFISWRIFLFITVFLGVFLVPSFGAKFPYYKELLESTNLPSWIWSFGNFDGVHYLTITKNWYLANYTQAFFPFYPMVIKFFSWGGNYLISALIVSNISFLISIFILYKLYRLDYEYKTSIRSIIFLVSFPTAFYFGSVYSESLFLLFTALFFLFLRKENYLLAGFWAALASGTRIFGAFLILAMLFELYKNRQRFKRTLQKINGFLAVMIAPLGVISYMIYLKINFDDPFFFLTSQPSFGAERSAAPFILLPQVFFRYIKIFLNVPILTPQFFNAALEFTFTILSIIFVVISFRKTRMSYLVFTIGCLLLPTLTGTLSSMPRYTLLTFLIFPNVILFAGHYFKYLILLSIVLQAVLVVLFTRGYWVS